MTNSDQASMLTTPASTPDALDSRATLEPGDTDGTVLPMTTTKGALSIAEAAEYLGVSRNAVYEAMYAGIISSVKLGRRRLIPVAALVSTLAQAKSVAPLIEEACERVRAGTHDVDRDTEFFVRARRERERRKRAGQENS